MKGHYKEMLDKGKCWKDRKICPLNKEFLEVLYSWSELNPLHPNLAWRICEPCENTGKPNNNWMEYA